MSPLQAKIILQQAQEAFRRGHITADQLAAVEIECEAAPADALTAEKAADRREAAPAAGSGREGAKKSTSSRTAERPTTTVQTVDEPQQLGNA